MKNLLTRYSVYGIVSMATASILLLAGCNMQPVSRDLSQPLNTVQSVNLKSYLGTWYEIYRLPNWFEDNECKTVTANYSLRDDGNIRVLNTCYQADKIKIADGIAKVVDTKTNAKLEVSFFRPFYGDYWILDLAPDYSWVLVGEKSGKYFWILARNPKLDPSLDKMLLDKARALGYMTERFIKPGNDLPIK
jgi:apolipoprotein D and lipocalin family protein